MLDTTIFFVALAATGTLNLLLLATIFSNNFTLWPTPGKKSWQSYIFWPLFRGGLGLTILLSVLEASFSGDWLWLRLGVGLSLIIIGFGITIYGYFDLGIDNTYGSDEGLVTDGLYKYSRNPQYVASIAGFLGLAVVAASWQVWVLCAAAICVYVLLPFTEEPWLEKAYGESYDRYKRMTPRFLNLRKLPFSAESEQYES